MRRRLYQTLDLGEDGWIEVKNGELCRFTQDAVSKEWFSVEKLSMRAAV